MLRKCSKIVVFVFCSLEIASCLADVVPISLSQQVGASGNVFICKIPLTVSGCEVLDSKSFSFTGSNSQSVTASGGGFTQTISADVQQSSNVSLDMISLQTFSFVQTVGAVKLGGSLVTATNIFDLEFDLTSQSIMHLTGQLSGGQLSFTGPGFLFQPISGPLDLLVTLDPGIYDLSDLANVSIRTGADFCCSVSSVAGVLLNADFTAVPEPRWAVLPPALLLIVCWSVARRKHFA